MPKLNICFAQVNPVWECPEINLAKASLLAEEAASNDSDIIIFPEQSATGWDPLSDKFRSDIFGEIPSEFSRIAKEYGIGVLGSFRESLDDRTCNTSVFFDNAGRKLCSYSKIHLFTPGKENRYYSPGEKPCVFEYRNIKFGLSVCYDLRFPDLYSYYSKCGCECVFIQAAWPKLRMKHWETFIHSRAAENQYFAAGINTAGKTPVDEYCGGSLLISPDGGTLMKADEDEGLFYGEIDTKSVEEARKNFSTLSDRRDDLYIGWSKE
ncbi:MAG: carbon-nitrogen hydrolase family protein [Methanomicrobium sp.]|nr:carbon-nitrogen hydrolase family protein [Methanomicrobium sp.]